ncbi:filamentation induced by cAMP protein Fic [mine drainage metagenome]|uniref:Filamentation induced by cAMP protein Fic n=2 Tax=mine drainage metagenome TaxID=410659 RepID=T1AFK8_9ZZZZ
MPSNQEVVEAKVMEFISLAGPRGTSISELQASPGERESRRTLQRALQDLALAKRIVMRGQGRGARYFEMAPAMRHGLGFAISENADRVWHRVRAPLGQRAPLGYNPAFIKSYQPNVGHYLTEQQRLHLREIGTVPSTARADTRRREIAARLLVDLSWASSHIEGNTYDRLSTARLIQEGVVAEGKTRDETQMILNHKAAIEFLLTGDERLRVDKLTVCNLHALLSENLLSNPEDAGKVRSHPVNIGQSTYIPLAGGTLLDQDLVGALEIVRAVHDPYEQAFCLFTWLPYLQPFTDVNKRTSRLTANVPLLKSGLCPLSFVGVEPLAYTSALLGVYELNDVSLARDLFIYACERSVQAYLAVDQTLAQPDPVRMARRTLIFNGVAAIVRDNPANQKAYAEEYVQKTGGIHGDVTEFDPVVRHILEDVQRLHEGNIFRYGIRLDEFGKWKDANKAAAAAAGNDPMAP